MAFWFLYICSPVVAIPVSLYGIKRRVPCAAIVFALILGTVAYCSIPYQDSYRHLEHYLYYSTYKLKNFTWYDFELNGAIVYIYALMGKYHIPYDFLRMFTVSTSFYLLFYIFKYKISQSIHNYTDQEYFIRFLIFCFFYDIFYTIEGVRYGFALSIYIFGVFLHLEKHSVFRFLLLVITASLFHSAFLLLTIASLFFYYINLSKRTFVIMVAIAYIALDVFMDKYNYLLGIRQDWYTSTPNVPSSSNYSSMTFHGFLGFALPKLCVLPYAYILITNYSKNSKWMKMTASWLLLSIISIPNPIFLYRIWWGFMALGIYMFLDTEKMYGNDKITSKRLLYASIFFAIFSLIPVYKMILKSNYYRLVYPAPMIFSEQYSKEYIDTMAPDAGFFVNKK